MVNAFPVMKDGVHLEGPASSEITTLADEYPNVVKMFDRKLCNVLEVVLRGHTAHVWSAYVVSTPPASLPLPI